MARPPSLALPHKAHKGGGNAFVRGVGGKGATGARDLIERLTGRTKARAFAGHGLPSPDRGVERGKGRGVEVVPANEAMGPKRPGVARPRHRRPVQRRGGPLGLPFSGRPAAPGLDPGVEFVQLEAGRFDGEIEIEALELLELEA